MKTWYSDSYAQAQHASIAAHLKPLIVDMLGPLYELSHVGINKNPDTGEVILRLHLNPLGRIRVASDPLRIR